MFDRFIFSTCVLVTLTGTLKEMPPTTPLPTTPTAATGRQQDSAAAQVHQAGSAAALHLRAAYTPGTIRPTVLGWDPTVAYPDVHGAAHPQAAVCQAAAIAHAAQLLVAQPAPTGRRGRRDSQQPNNLNQQMLSAFLLNQQQMGTAANHPGLAPALPPRAATPVRFHRVLLRTDPQTGQLIEDAVAFRPVRRVAAPQYPASFEAAVRLPHKITTLAALYVHCARMYSAWSHPLPRSKKIRARR